MLYKYPSEGDSCKEFVVSLRSFLSLKRALKLQDHKPKYLGIDDAVNERSDLDINMFN
jgi:hypothetical protein